MISCYLPSLQLVAIHSSNTRWSRLYCFQLRLLYEKALASGWRRLGLYLHLAKPQTVSRVRILDAGIDFHWKLSLLLSWIATSIEWSFPRFYSHPSWDSSLLCRARSAKCNKCPTWTFHWRPLCSHFHSRCPCYISGQLRRLRLYLRHFVAFTANEQLNQ